jgi:hypothetical protein
MVLCELERALGEVATSLPVDRDEGPEIVLDSSSIPRLPERLRTDRILLRRAVHSYGTGYRVDSIHLFAGPRVLRLLGLAVLSRLFHPDPTTITIESTHPDSEIRTLVLQLSADDLQGNPIGYSWSPASFRYWPSEISKHPWLDDDATPWDLPLLYLTNEEDLVVSNEQWQSRDSIRGLGTDRGFVRFADLCLNAGCPWNEVREFELEGEPGFRGVAPTSAEVRIFLPGSDHWNVLTSPPAV